MKDNQKSTEKKTLRSRFCLRNNRKLRIGATATAITAVIVAVVVVLNVVCGLIADRFPWTIDLTADKTFSLSEESITVAKAIKKPVEIDVLLGEDNFSNPNTESEELNIVFRQFYLFTKEYNNLSGGNVTTNYVDLVSNPTLSTEYTQKYGAESGDIVFRCGTQYRVISTEELYEQDTDYYSYSYIYSLVEEKLVSLISSITSDKKITITFLTGHGENEDAIKALAALYQLNGYYTDTINLATGDEIDETTGAIVIVGPTQDYADQIDRLQNWLLNDGKRGRHLFVYLNYQGDNKTLTDFLIDYGIEVTSNVIMETDTANFLSNQPDAPITTVSATDLTSSVSANNKKVVMPWTLQLKTKLTADTENEMETNHTMVSFGESARLQKVPYETIDLVEAESYPLLGMVYAKKAELINSVRTETNIVVSGSYHMLAYIQSTLYENEALVLEPLFELCDLGDAPPISNKNVSASTVTYSQAASSALSILFMYGIPAILIIVCLVVFFKRRHL